MLVKVFESQGKQVGLMEHLLSLECFIEPCQRALMMDSKTHDGMIGTAGAISSSSEKVISVINTLYSLTLVLHSCAFH